MSPWYIRILGRVGGILAHAVFLGVPDFPFRGVCYGDPNLGICSALKYSDSKRAYDILASVGFRRVHVWGRVRQPIILTLFC